MNEEEVEREVERAGMPITEVRPYQIITFGDHTGWRRVLWVGRQGETAVVHMLWHRRRVVPASTRIWIWES